MMTPVNNPDSELVSDWHNPALMQSLQGYCHASFQRRFHSSSDGWYDDFFQDVCADLVATDSFSLSSAINEEESSHRKTLKRSIWKNIQRLSRGRSKLQSHRSFSDHDYHVADPHVEDPSAFMEELDLAEMREIIHGLQLQWNNIYQQILDFILNEDLTNQEIAKKMQLKEAQVSKMRYTIIRRCQRALQKQGRASKKHAA